MAIKIYDSQETLKAGLEAEKATVIEYTGYLNLAKQAGNESEIKLWEHIIKDEQEHIKEFENALKGDFNLLDNVNVVEKTEEEILKENERDEEFSDRINDVLVDGGMDWKSYRISNENDHFYVDFDGNKEACIKAYDLLRDSFFKCDFVDDGEGFYYVHILRR